MLSPIPSRILRDTLTLYVPSAVSRYQTVTNGASYTVNNVHIQGSNDTRITTDNTEVSLRALLFVDVRNSSPNLDYMALQSAAQKAGGVMTCSVKHRNSTTTGTYTVLVVEAVPDDDGNVHHWELGLV